MAQRISSQTLDRYAETTVAPSMYILACRFYDQCDGYSAENVVILAALWRGLEQLPIFKPVIISFNISYL